MPFPRKLLNEGEDVVLDLHPHWWVFAAPVALLVLDVAVAVAVASLDWPNWVFYAVLVVAAAALVWTISRFLVWTTTNFVVTTDRLIYRSGVVSKHGKEIPLERLNDISFHQSIFERMIGAGDLEIESGGEKGQQRFSDIKHPARVQNEIYRQVEANATRDAHRASGQRELSVPEQIEKLDELRQRGVISQAEFEAKKAQLLDRM
ncbi:MAG TPA: PH domain-containing protein [Acidimicrobiales bacterium]|nr:PH domain-containing protein [Acidimicrobiales bacterium]